MAEKKRFKNSNKPNGWKIRNALRAANHAWMQRFKVKTRQFRRERTRQPVGMPQGLHNAKDAENCRCGSCSRGYKKGQGMVI